MPRFTFSSKHFQDDDLNVSRYARLNINSAIQLAQEQAKDTGETWTIRNGLIKIAEVDRRGKIWWTHPEGFYRRDYARTIAASNAYLDEEENA